MGKSNEITGRILYGLLFAAIIPLILILWAKFTRNTVTIPLPVTLLPGYILLFTGAIFVCIGMWNIWRLGNGLPMSAFPPEKYVRNGIYAFIKHPIYFGAALVSFGLSAITRSSSGFWLVSPLFTLLMVAYTTGYENERTQSVFGTQDHKPFLSLPPDSNIMPSFGDRLSSYFLVFVPWLIVYKAFVFIGAPDDAISTNLPFEENLPIWEFSTVFYSFAFLFSLLVPLIVKTRKQLRSFISDVWFAIIIVGIIYLVFPLVVNQKDFIPHSFLGRIILYERSIDGESGALPSCHVIWAFLAAKYFSRSFVSFKWIWYGLAVLISLSCITVGAHSVLDVVAGFGAFIIIIYRQQIWTYIRLRAERLSNSLKEWRIGPVRIINHGFYGGAAGFTGTLLTGFFLGSRYSPAGFIILIFVIIGAALWAQIIEGSPKLLRPFGHYGGLAGGTAGCLLAHFIFSTDIFILLASVAMAAPWIQATGRLGCLVQGCCHGKPSGENAGIRFIHPYSRVNKISGLSGVPLHPTQLYSIGANIITGLVLIRLFNIGISSSFIVGIYLILNGTGRFVEESFRGEAQTPYWAGMRLYQWLAILNIFLGIIFTVIPGREILVFQPNILSLTLAIGMGIVVIIASGVDLPESNRRFARLTSN
jgi:membrane-associated phospholipid phosphatase/protein-S-isoprenylcysteine O-methyltransferase Ste14